MSNASLKEQLQAVASQLSDVQVAAGRSGDLLPNAVGPKRNKDARVPKKPKPKWLDYVQYGVDLLRIYFPEGFKSGNEIKPLKKGIKQDLLKRLSAIDSIVVEDKACMVKSLTYYVNTTAYHKSVVEGAPRIDLDGVIAGHVSAEEAKYSYDRAQAKLKARAYHPNKEGATS